MKHPKIYTLQDGLTGEILFQADSTILSNNVISSIVEDMFEKTSINNEHDLFIKVVYKQ